MPRIVTDIDGTLIDKDGQTMTQVVDYIKAEAEEVVVLTNRPESEREKTVADLKATGLEYAQLIMNKDGTPAPEFKAATVKAMLDAGVEVDEFIDNDQANRDAVEALGVEVCDPAEIMAGEEEVEEETMEEAAAFDRTAKIKNAMSKLTPEAELTDLRTVALALTAERDDLRATVEKLTVGAADELASAKADISAKDSRIAELTAELDQFKAVADAANAKVEAVEKTAVSAAKQAADIVASTGIDPVAVNPTAPIVSKEAVDHVATFLALPVGTKERTDYWKANQHQIVRGLSF
jgi:ribonucleotide monophosphatase NagD (HAD superfamily)